jgi:hypothetical protein
MIRFQQEQQQQQASRAERIGQQKHPPLGTKSTERMGIYEWNGPGIVIDKKFIMAVP